MEILPEPKRKEIEMSTKDMRIELMKLADAALEVANFIDKKGTKVQYEVEFVGGSRPVDTPHTSAGHLAQRLQKDAVELFGSWEFSQMIVDVEDAERFYDEEYTEAVRDLDLGV